MGSVVFSRPNLTDLISRVTQQLGVNLPGLTPQQRRSTLTVMSIVLSQELYQLYAYIDNFAGWFFVSTAEGIYLDRKGNPIGVPRLQGSPADIPVTFQGISGYTIPAGSVVQTEDQSLSYTVDAAIELAGGTGSGTATCTTPGSAGSLAAGVVVTLAQAIAGVAANAVVGAGGTPGVDVESDDDYRVRILQRLQQTPQGGAGNDYIAWCKLVGGVTRVFVYPMDVSGTDAGAVTVAPVYDGRGGAFIIPTSADLTNIVNTVTPLKPVTATLHTLALTPDGISIAIAGLSVKAGFTLATVQANIAASLTSLFASTTAGGATFGDGIPWGTTGGFLGLDDIYDAIKQSAGVHEFDLTSPTADINSAAGHLAVLSLPITYS